MAFVVGPSVVVSQNHMQGFCHTYPWCKQGIHGLLWDLTKISDKVESQKCCVKSSVSATLQISNEPMCREAELLLRESRLLGEGLLQ